MKTLLLTIVVFVTLFFLTSASVRTCVNDGAVVLEQYSLEYVEDMSSSQQVLENQPVGVLEETECQTGMNICEIDCETIPGCSTKKIVQAVLTGYYKNALEKASYHEVCERRGRNNVEGLTYVDRNTPFSKRFRALISSIFPNAQVPEQIKKINSDWYYTQAFLIANKALIEPYGELTLVLADLKYIYQGIQSVCLKHKNWENTFGRLMMDLEKDPIYTGIANVVNKYKTIANNYPKSLKGTVYKKYIEAKQNLIDILKSLIRERKFQYCPCTDLVIYDKLRNSKQSGANVIKQFVKKECGCDYKAPTKNDEEPLGYVEKILTSSNPNQGSKYIIENDNKELNGAVRDPNDLRKGRKQARKDRQYEKQKKTGNGAEFAEKHYQKHGKGHGKGGRKG